MATLAPSLAHLLREIDARWPRRARDIDGWYRKYVPGARPSDHHPDNKGMVHAIDVTSAGILPMTLVAVVARNVMPTTYVIYARRIYSASYGWVSRYYTGPHDHYNHVHVSIGYSSGEENYTGPWGIANVPAGPPPPREGFGPAEPWIYSEVIQASARLLPDLGTGLSVRARDIRGLIR